MNRQLRELSVRQDPRSGELREHVDIDANAIAGESLAVILIHGYNNDEAEARASFVDFQKSLIELRLPKVYLKSLWRFYWPGNARNSILSTISYPIQIGKARDSALRLSQFINAILANSDTEFIFIAHSLGCRLLLESMKLLNPLQGRRARVKLSALMAAAVPSKFINDKTFDMHSKGYTSIAGLFSPNDTTLKFAFPLGQTAGLEGFFPEALGLNGNPMAFWTAGWSNTGLNHGSYWSSPEVAKFLARALGVAVPRVLEKNSLQTRKMFSYKDGRLHD